LCAEQFRAKENPALIAKWEKTEQEAHHPARGLFANMYLAAGTYDKSEQHYSQMVFEALKECDDPQERAQRMLEMLIEHSQTSQGFLYTMQRSGPALYAQVGSSHQSVEIDAMVNKYITAELDGTVDATATNMVGDYYNRTTSEWTGQNGEEYRPVLLAHYTEKGYAVTGLAVLQIDPNKTFIYPAEIVIALSKFAFDSGDVTTCFATCLSE
jgi:hypothetical protein